MVNWLGVIVLFYLLLAVGLMRLAVRLLHKRIRFFESAHYLRHKAEYQILAAVIIWIMKMVFSKSKSSDDSVSEV